VTAFLLMHVRKSVERAPIRGRKEDLRSMQFDTGGPARMHGARATEAERTSFSAPCVYPK
jgi:hypothetical protein